MKNITSSTVSRLALLSLLGALVLGLGWPRGGVAQDKPADSGRHRHADKSADASKDLAVQVRELQAKVAKLEDALKQGHKATPAGTPDTGAMAPTGGKKAGMGMPAMGGTEEMDRDEMMQMMGKMMQMMGGGNPMAVNVSDIYCRHPEDRALDMKLLMDEKRCPLCCKQYHLARTPDESKALNRHSGPLVIISASGMATGGRILHHLKLRLPDPRTTVLLVGFQPIGTRGRALQEGARTVHIHGQDVPVRGKVETLDGLSAHADREEILRWLSGFRRPPTQTYTVHGVPPASESLTNAILTRLRWKARVARDGETVPLTP
jgi:hypothetical protein